jgi:hypothetical protein
MLATCVLVKKFEDDSCDLHLSMWEEILKAVPVAFSSALKFIFGPLGGYAIGLHWATTMAATVCGMMLSVTAFTFFGDWLREKIVHRFFRNRKAFSPGKRRFVTVWKKYGLAGVALLTPLIFTPIGGTVLAVAFGSDRQKLLVYMFFSAVIWSAVFTALIYLFGHTVLPGFVRG